MRDFLLTDADKTFRDELRDFLARELLPRAPAIENDDDGRIAANPPQALRWTKRLIREGLQASLPTALQMSAAFQDMAHHTGDHQEAIAALFEKRLPDFRSH